MELRNYDSIDSLLKISEKEYDKNELSMGIEVEKEHAPTYNFIKKFYEENGKFPDELEIYESIAKDHLDEYEDYYTRLNKAEL